MALDTQRLDPRFQEVKRELMLAVDPALYPDIEGSTNSETFFFLALTLGLDRDPPVAVERAVGLIERVGRNHGIEHPIQMTVATSNGQNVWAFRYSSEGRSRSLFIRPKPQRCELSIRTTRCSTRFPMRRGWSSRSHLGALREHGMKYRNRATA